MKYTAVMAVPGRVAFTAPRGGDRIPHDQWKTVAHTPWIELLLRKHGDIVAKPDEPAKAAAPAKKKDA